MGVIPGSRFRVVGGLPLVDFSSEPTARPFIHSLRPICETVFNLLLVAYIAILKVFRDRSASRHGQRKSLDGWDKALKFAEEHWKSPRMRRRCARSTRLSMPMQPLKQPLKP